MPVRIWDQGPDGLHSKVQSDWVSEWTPEEHREQAEQLDRQLDSVLDSAITSVQHFQSSANRLKADFVRAWAVGQALRDSHILDSSSLTGERRQLLWLALARKCRLGARSTGMTEPMWISLRPKSATEPRREGGRLDYFEMCAWLAEQDLNDAAFTFGGQVRNAWQMLERPAIRPLKVRRALFRWMSSLSDDARSLVTSRPVFANMMKTLRQRWPNRGPGSAKGPVHMDEDAIYSEVKRLLNPYGQGQRAPSR